MLLFFCRIDVGDKVCCVLNLGKHISDTFVIRGYLLPFIKHEVIVNCWRSSLVLNFVKLQAKLFRKTPHVDHSMVTSSDELFHVLTQTHSSRDFTSRAFCYWNTCRGFVNGDWFVSAWRDDNSGSRIKIGFNLDFLIFLLRVVPHFLHSRQLPETKNLIMPWHNVLSCRRNVHTKNFVFAYSFVLI